MCKFIYIIPGAYKSPTKKWKFTIWKFSEPIFSSHLIIIENKTKYFKIKKFSTNYTDNKYILEKVSEIIATYIHKTNQENPLQKSIIFKYFWSEYPNTTKTKKENYNIMDSVAEPVAQNGVCKPRPLICSILDPSKFSSFLVVIVVLPTDTAHFPRSQ